ncbi:MAG: MFS transporter [Candidatus Thorarchaeota archaeon]|nr:MFS transporter [Candidatus Thorarchaeota archaeon]
MSVAPVLLPKGSTSDVIETRRHEILGLNGRLWRLALVAGIAQLSVSIWTWQFAIFLDTFLNPWDIGLTFTIGTLAALVGYPISGALADVVGRKKTMIFSFIPLCLGLFMLYIIPVWPYVVASYGLTQFGWSFIIIITRAMPADEIAREHMMDSTKKFTMVLMPAFLMDGISPILAVLLIQSGSSLSYLLLIGAVAGIVALLLTVLFVQETLHPETKRKARLEPKVSIRKLGQKFWYFTGGMVGYYLAWGLAIPYLGPLSVDAWGIDVSIYGLTWSAFSLSTVLLMYGLSSFADRGRRRALIVGLAANGLIMILFGIGSGVLTMFALNILWAGPIVVWIGVERSLAIDGVADQFKGRALATYQLITSITGLIATPAGALIWEITSSLRFLWILSGLLALLSLSIIYWSIYYKPRPDITSNVKIRRKRVVQSRI